MRKKSTFLSFVFVLALAPFFTKGQTAINVKSEEAVKWNPVVLDKDGSNKIGNVAFYSKSGYCGSDEVVFLKVLNGNPHPVKIQWQAGPNSPVVEEIVPAQTDVQGYCPLPADKVRSGLVITNIPKSEEEKAMARRYALTHLKVIDLKN